MLLQIPDEQDVKEVEHLSLGRNELFMLHQMWFHPLLSHGKQ